jgi:hypothetical protein
MGAYWIIFLILSIFAVLDFMALNPSRKAVFIGFGSILLVLFSGLRGAIDNDYVNYQEIYYWISRADLYRVLFTDVSDPFFDVEPGYRLLNKLVYYTLSNYQFVFLACAALSVGVTTYSYKQLSPFPLLSLLLYLSHTYLLRDMMQIRAGVAAALCLLSLMHLDEQRHWKFILTGILAAMFHVAVIPFVLLMPFLSWLRPGKRFLTVVLGAALVIGILYPFGALIRLMPAFDLLYKVQGYANSEHGEAIGLANPVLIKQVLISVGCLFLFEQLCERFRYFRVLFLSYLVSTCWLLVFNDFGIIAGRIATFFSVTEVVLIPMLLFNFLQEDRWAASFMYVLMIAYACTFYYINLHVRDYFLPYQFSATIANSF